MTLRSRTASCEASSASVRFVSTFRWRRSHRLAMLVLSEEAQVDVAAVALGELVDLASVSHRSVVEYVTYLTSRQTSYNAGWPRS